MLQVPQVPYGIEPSHEAAARVHEEQPQVVGRHRDERLARARSELDRLHADNQNLALTLEQLELTDSEREVVAVSLRKMNDVGVWAETYALRSSRVFAIQLVCAIGVPLFILAIGQGSEQASQYFRTMAIVLSMVGTFTRAIEDAYDWRLQADVRQRSFARMRALFDSYCSLSGEYFEASTPAADASPTKNGSGKQAGRERRAQPAASGASTPNSCTSLVTVSTSAPAPAPSPQPPPAAADELAPQHSGANFRKYVVEFSSLEERCNAQLRERGRG